LFKCGTSSYARLLKIKHCDTIRADPWNHTKTCLFAHEMMLQERLNFVLLKQVLLWFSGCGRAAALIV